MARLRVHNEYFRTVQAPVCNCGCMVRKLRRGKMTGNIDAVWSWGEYVAGKWRTVIWFCERCYERRVLGRLLSHKRECGCDFKLVGYESQTLPAWLTLGEEKCKT